MCSNPKEQAMGDYMGQVQSYLNQLNPSSFSSMSLSDLDTRTNKLYDEQLSAGNTNIQNAFLRAMRENSGRAGQSAYAQASALNLSNPFALKNLQEGRAAGDVTRSFAGQFSGLNENLMNQKNAQLLNNLALSTQSKNSALAQYYNTIAALLGQKGGAASQRDEGAANWLPGTGLGLASIFAPVLFPAALGAAAASKSSGGR